MEGFYDIFVPVMLPRFRGPRSFNAQRLCPLWVLSGADGE